MSDGVASAAQGESAEESTRNALQSLCGGALLRNRADAGLLVLSDADRHDFLHRMTTNEINGLRPGQSVVTILTSPTARTEYVFTVVCRPEELWLLPADGEAEALARNLKGKIFFMDAVKAVDASAEWTRMRLVGDRAGEALATLGIDLAGGDDGAWAANDGLVAVKQLQFDVPGYELLIPADDADALTTRLAGAGVLPFDEEAYQVARIKMGRPAPGAELTDAYNPLESGMAWVCADNKGCYTGQEIIARQVNYDKVTKNLVGLVSDAMMTPGESVTIEDRAVGTITSAAYDPLSARFFALAIIKRPANAPGTEVAVGEISATVVPLPIESLPIESLPCESQEPVA